jgi:pantoate--beta-alanine ligase
MLVTDEISKTRAARWMDPTLSWGVVPTMGYLHEGHLALVQQARAENDRVAVSIFVNPTQFAPTEDLGRYPRNMDSDLTLLRNEDVDLVFAPTVEVMYPSNFQTKIIIEAVTRPLEGAARPGHFQGVATVVAKLFNILQPTRAYFGQKDAQQVAVIRRMAVDLNFNLQVVICPTVREADGLALSSRNSYLSAAERAAAPVLYQALQAAQAAYLAGERSGETLRQLMRTTIETQPLARIDYVSAADPITLEELTTIKDGVLFSMAVFLGKTRLIDNILVEGQTTG